MVIVAILRALWYNSDYPIKGYNLFKNTPTFLRWGVFLATKNHLAVGMVSCLKAIVGYVERSHIYIIHQKAPRRELIGSVVIIWTVLITPQISSVNHLLQQQQHRVLYHVG